MKVTEWPVGKLKPYDKNPRKNDQAVDAVARSIKEFGFRQPIVVDGAGVIIVGHTRWKAAKKLGMKTVPVHVADGLTAAQARAYRIADNASNEIAEWDMEALGKELEGLKADGFDFAGLELPEIDGLPKDEPEADAEPQMDLAAELNKKWGVKPGDLWLIGEHRLLAGDSTKAADVARLLGDSKPVLMVTDPPYGVEYDPTWRDECGGQFGGGKTVMRGKVDNDDRCDWREAWALFPGDVIYVWHASLRCADVLASLEASGFVRRAQIVWVKQHFTLMRTGYHWQHEPCWYCVRKGGTGHWSGDRKQTTVWEIDSLNAAGRKGAKDEQETKVGHGTQKPLECMARPMRNHDAPEVYDPFLGSGTTMVAAQNLGRKCYGLEIAPGYCAVILERMITAFPSIDIRRSK